MTAIVFDHWTLTLAACVGLAVAWLAAATWLARRRAETRALRAHLTDGSLSPRPQHVTFTRSTLFGLAARDAEGLLMELSGPGADDLLANAWHDAGDAVARSQPDAPYLPPTGLEAIPARVAGRPAAVVRLPAPTAATEAHFVALVLNHELGDPPKAAPEPDFFYFLLEKSVAGEAGPWRVATPTIFAQRDGFTRRHLGPGPAADARAFLERIAEHFAAAEARTPRAPVGPKTKGPSAD